MDSGPEELAEAFSLGDNMVQALLESVKLKDVTRAGWIRADVSSAESVAAHSWGVAWLVALLCPPELDRERALSLALIHDLAEVRTGDITPYDGVAAQDKVSRERQAMAQMLGDIPQAQACRAWQREYQERLTPEALFVHRCDKLDMALQAVRYMQDQPALDLREFLESARQALHDK